ncbi:NAD(P)/FAD-dependent oxidoreductase [Jatrophihabitans sp.]|uniref:flavin-containing monooxygenase n=1 Tax=Jatrophihabitans sp. TaxID=1932789 RepID=UPI0030C6830C|nr:hapE 5 [Jatrophihabitans sp.]
MTRPFEVAIIGAGMSGLFLAHHLKEAGITYQIFERRDGVGGTWHDNTYPGLHVDVATRRYEFPFARSNKWSKRYAPGSEIRGYFESFAKTDGLLPNIRFSEEVTEARWTDGRWVLSTSKGNRVEAAVVVAATGFLRVPRRPAIPGAESFAGPSFHSSEWNHDVDLRGKRIGIIGTGSSGIQIVSELGRANHDVTHFIRTPQWMQVRANPRVNLAEKVLLKVPALRRYWDWRTARNRIETEGPETWRLEPGPERDRMTQRFHDELRKAVQDPGLLAKLTPTEPPGCKRIPKTPDYYTVVQRPNVTPVFGGIDRIEPNGIVSADGVLHELDVIVYATGFDTHAYMRPMKVVGPDDATIDELWRDGVYSYRGVGVPSLPNFFLLCGPFAPVNSLSIPTTLEHEVGFLLRVFDEIKKTGAGLAPTVAATEQFRAEIGKVLPNTTYSLCDNWYRDQAGTAIIWPFVAQRHLDQYAEVNLGAEFELFPISGETARTTSTGS